MVDEIKTELDTDKIAYDHDMPIGGMIEVPAAAICADIFARHLDFLSIGTNDLIQYTIAIDRVNDEVNYLYDPLHPAVLRLINITLLAGKKANIPVAMCGEMAGDPNFTRLLLGLGLREFSMEPSQLLEIRQQVLTSCTADLIELAGQILNSSDSHTSHRLLDTLNAGSGV